MRSIYGVMTRNSARGDAACPTARKASACRLCLAVYVYIARQSAAKFVYVLKAAAEMSAVISNVGRKIITSHNGEMSDSDSNIAGKNSLEAVYIFLLTLGVKPIRRVCGNIASVGNAVTRSSLATSSSPGAIGDLEAAHLARPCRH